MPRQNLEILAVLAFTSKPSMKAVDICDHTTNITAGLFEEYIKEFLNNGDVEYIEEYESYKLTEKGLDRFHKDVKAFAE